MYKLKNDRYRKFRGGVSKFYALYCHRCFDLKFIYQKDGIGELKRLYLDRIHDGKDVTGVCSKCGYVFGQPFMYKKEFRPAIRLFVGGLEKEVYKQ